MARLAHRFDTVQVVSGNALHPGSGYFVSVLKPGAISSGISASSPIAVHAGHGFVAGDKFIVGTTTGQIRTVSSVTATSIAYSGSNVSVTTNDQIVNIGSDSQTAGANTPNWDGADVKIFSDPGATTALTNSVASTNSDGEYEYYSDRTDVWEAIRSSSTVVKQVIVVNIPSATRTLYPTGGTSQEDGINAAIQAVSKFGGGIVELGPGSFIIDGPIVPASNVWIRGSGAQQTTIFVKASTAINAIGYTGASAVSNIEISDLTIDGNFANQTASGTGCGVLIYNPTDVKVHDLYVKNTPGSAVSLRAVDVDGIRVSVKNCTASSVGSSTTTDGGYGLHFSALSGMTLSDVLVDSNTVVTVRPATAVTGDGILFSGVGTISRTTTTNNHVRDCNGAGIRFSPISGTGAFSDMRIAGNTITSVGNASNGQGTGIQCHVASQQCQIINNVINTVAATGANGIEVLQVNAGGSTLGTDVMIQGNKISGLASTRTAAMSIVCFNTSNVSIANNVIRNCVTGGILVNNSSLLTSAQNVSIVGNTVDSVNTSAASIADANHNGIEVKGVQVFTISGNTIRNIGDGTATTSYSRGIQVEPGGATYQGVESVIAGSVTGNSVYGTDGDGIRVSFITAATKYFSGGAAQTITFAATTATRSAGSWTTDGFAVNDRVTFLRAGSLNNGVRGIITTLTATVMTCAASAFDTSEGALANWYVSGGPTTDGTTASPGGGPTNFVTVSGNSIFAPKRNGIAIIGCSGLSIANNICAYMTRSGIIFDGSTAACTNTIVDGNVLSNSLSFYGVEMGAGTYSGFTISNNYSTGHNSYGMLLAGTTLTASSINGNTIANCTGASGIAFGTTVTACNISGNTCVSNGTSVNGDGIRLVVTTGTDINVTGNTCTSNGRSGIRTSGCTRMLISGNVCEANAASGMYLVAPSQTFVSSNLVRANGTGILGAADKDGITVDCSAGTTTDCFVDGNMILSNAGDGSSLGVRIVTGGTLTRVGVGNSNYFFGNSDAVSSSTSAGGSVSKFVGPTLAGVTPDVSGVRYAKVTNGGGVTVTNFTGGFDGQVLFLVHTDGNTTYDDGANFVLVGGADLTPTADDVVIFTNVGGVWYQSAAVTNN